MTLSDILADVYDRLNYSDSPPQKVTRRITRFINQRHRQILSMPSVAQLRDGTLPLTTFPNQAVYALPPTIGRINGISDPDHLGPLTRRSPAWLRTVATRSNVGQPEAWIPLSAAAVQQQPTEEVALYVRSTSAGDTANATVEYIRLGGYPATATITLTGETPVQVGVDEDVVQVTKFYLSAPADGFVTLETANANGTLLSTIAPGQSRARFLTIQLHPTPSGNDTLLVDYTREIPDLSQPYDEPLLPEDYHYLLSVGARIDEYEKTDDNRRLPLLHEWTTGIRRLVNYVINTPDLIVVPGGQSPRWSSLGPMFPAGT